MEFIENPYRIIKNLSQVIDRLAVDAIDAKIYIKTNTNEYVIYLYDNTYTISLITGDQLYENLELEPFLKWINTNVLDIILIELDLNLTQETLAPIVFYDCNRPGCYAHNKYRTRAARVIQKHAIPRYNDPSRPEVRARMMREFNSFGKKKLKSNSIQKDIRYLINLKIN